MALVYARSSPSPVIGAGSRVAGPFGACPGGRWPDFREELKGLSQEPSSSHRCLKEAPERHEPSLALHSWGIVRPNEVFPVGKNELQSGPSSLLCRNGGSKVAYCCQCKVV